LPQGRRMPGGFRLSAGFRCPLSVSARTGCHSIAGIRLAAWLIIGTKGVAPLCCLNSAPGSL
jgi:hypothetical protein